MDVCTQATTRHVHWNLLEHIVTTKLSFHNLSPVYTGPKSLSSNEITLDRNSFCTTTTDCCLLTERNGERNRINTRKVFVYLAAKLHVCEEDVGRSETSGNVAAYVHNVCFYVIVVFNYLALKHMLYSFCIFEAEMRPFMFFKIRSICWPAEWLLVMKHWLIPMSLFYYVITLFACITTLPVAQTATVLLL
jgi:hypothetical protein